jgi:hypothetical protein
LRRVRVATAFLFLSLSLGLAGGSGCARLKPVRQDQGDPTPFGTYPATSEAANGTKTSPADLYADRLNSSRSRMDKAPTPAEAVEPKEQLASLDPADDVQGPKVALQPPVALPSYPTTRPDAADQATTELASVSQPLVPAAPASFEPADPVEVVAPAPAPAPAPEPAPALTTAPAPAGPGLESILAESRRRLSELSSYQVKMSHQERVGDNLNAAEDVVLSIRRNPKAVRIEWREGAHKGREVIYAADSGQGKMHINMADSVIPVPRLSMPPDSPLAMKNSRHPITEAGFDTILANMEKGLARDRGGPGPGGTIRYAGLETPQGLDSPCHKITRVTPDHEEWVVYLDARTYFPALVQANAANGDLLERYVFRDVQPNLAELATPAAFDPDARWGTSKGLFQRIARSAGADAPSAETR